MARPRNHIERGYYSVKDIADLLDMKPKWVRERIKAAEFDAFKAGKVYKISGSSVNRWIDKHLVVAA